MSEKSYGSGVLKIVNAKKNRTYYIAAESPVECLAAQKELLERGRHANCQLQSDYTDQKGEFIAFEIICDDIDHNAAVYIKNMWIEADDTAYNSKTAKDESN